MDDVVMARLDYYIAKLKAEYPKLKKKRNKLAKPRIQYLSYRAMKQLSAIVSLANAS